MIHDKQGVVPFPLPALNDRDNMNRISELQHLLVKLAFEASELSHAALKGVEFGIDHPYPDTGVTILEKIQQEFNDVLGVAKMLKSIGFAVHPDADLTNAKIDKVSTMMNVAREYGVLDRVSVLSSARMTKVFDEFHCSKITKVFDCSLLNIRTFCAYGVSHPSLVKDLIAIAEAFEADPNMDVTLKLYMAVDIDPECGGRVFPELCVGGTHEQWSYTLDKFVMVDTGPSDIHFMSEQINHVVPVGDDSWRAL